MWGQVYHLLRIQRNYFKDKWKRGLMKIFIILEKDLKTYEDKILQIGKENKVVNTDFWKIDDTYVMRMECQ
jgi:hypothetical protein